jgi:hypothetical protein
MEAQERDTVRKCFAQDKKLEASGERSESELDLEI